MVSVFGLLFRRRSALADGELAPACEHLRSEPSIIAGIALATRPDTKVPWPDLIADYDRIRDAIEGVFPDFRDYNKRIRHPEGFIVVAYDIARGSVAAYCPEANGIVPLSYHDAQSGTPSYKSVPVRITRRAA